VPLTSRNTASSAPRTRLQPTLITIGEGPAFRSVFEWLQSAVPDCPLSHYSTLDQALQALDSAARLPDIAIVFRSWCDEHPQALVQRFIGRMFFQRIICCEGPLCMSEARTHLLWPAACRTTPAAAPARIARDLHQFHASQSPLSPLAAAEDVFAFEAKAGAPPTSQSSSSLRAFVLISDAVLRETALELLRECRVRAESGDGEILRLLAANSIAVPDCVIVDADEPFGLHTELLQLKHRGARIFALTGFPGAAIPDWASEMLDKTELPLQLSCLPWCVTGRRL
jgi:hypothetical protein